MALSNIIKEPRREITETLVGIAVLALPVYADWRWSVWFRAHCGCPDDGGANLFGMIIGVFGLGIGSLILLGIHELGNAVCNSLDRRGIQLRPTQRYR